MKLAFFFKNKTMLKGPKYKLKYDYDYNLDMYSYI